MTEAALMAWICAIGLLLTAPLQHAMPRSLRFALALPSAIAAYLIFGWVLAILGAFSPLLALWSATTTALVVTSVGLKKGEIDISELVPAAAALGGVVVLSLLVQIVPATRVTPDSLQYLSAASNLATGGDYTLIRPYNIANRQIMLPVLYALAGVRDELLLTSLMPVLAVSALTCFALISVKCSSLLGLDRCWGAVLAVLGLGIILSSNRAVFNAFYVHTHLVFGLYFFLVVAGAWLGVVTKRREWWALVCMSIPILVGIRVEGFLVLLLVLIPILATETIPFRLRLSVVAVFTASVLLWFGFALAPYAETGHRLGPVLVALLLSASVVLLRWRRLAGPARFAPHAMLSGLAAALLFFALRQPELLRETVGAVYGNIILGEGLWRWTWVGLPPLLFVSAALARFPHRSLFTVPLFGFALLMLILAPLRGHAYRLGSGDSGSRMLFHILMVAVLFLVLTAAAALGRRGPESRARGSSRTVLAQHDSPRPRRTACANRVETVSSSGTGLQPASTLGGKSPAS